MIEGMQIMFPFRANPLLPSSTLIYVSINHISSSRDVSILQKKKNMMWNSPIVKGDQCRKTTIKKGV